MNKETFIEEIALLAGGASPFDENSEEPSFYIERRQRWMENNKQNLVQLLPEVIKNPPASSEYYPIEQKDFELEITEIVESLDDVPFKLELLKAIGEKLKKETSGKTYLFYLIAALKLPEGWTYLSEIDFSALEFSEQAAFIYALGEIKNLEAFHLLKNIHTENITLVLEKKLAMERYDNV